MKKCLLLAGWFLLAFCFVGCETEFDPNDDYKEQMMVYCILDKNADTTFARIERCFLGTGNALTYAKNKDSIYYKPEDLEVKLYAYTLDDTLNAKKTYNLTYTLRGKDEGSFAGGETPIYYCVTKNQLQEYPFYKLEITNTQTGLVAKASTHMVTEFEITSTDLRFQNAETSNNLTAFKDIHWSGYNNTSSREVNRAKSFQLNLKFFYGKNGTTEIDSIDMTMMSRLVTGATQSDNYTRITVNDVIQKLKEGLTQKGQTSIKLPNMQNFVICVYGCNKDMADYMSTNNASENSLNYKPMYSNIVNGYGLFASKNTETKVINQNQISNNFWTELGKIINIVQ
ncbi:MAG: hypothetical protein Q4Q06_00715 [Bacteroidota bacterium]|nr:hypothetical protein [Bacteroidota bacterium]